MKRCRLITLGCKVNQCESAALGQQMQAAGYQVVWHAGEAETDVDVVIVNTCTVTGKAGMQSRQAIRRAVRSHPGARIVVTGCYAQTAAGEISGIEGVELIVGNTDKLRIAELLEEKPGAARNDRPFPVPYPADAAATAFEPLPACVDWERTRAFLKIQDGCNAMCSYCIVPYARGRSSSMPLSEVLMHLRQLGDAGFREVVLTGIHLGLYGADLDPIVPLADLLEETQHRRPVHRIRLSSIEPAEVDNRIIQQAADRQGGLCRHFHIPLQSGADSILRRMGRPYTRDQFAGVISTIREKMDDAAIGADVLVGFPGEDESAFELTYELIDCLPLTYLHVFPFSPRPGTPAAGFKPRVPERIVKERCLRLRHLGEAKKAAFYCSLVGRQVEVLIQAGADTTGGLASGLTSNYIPVRVMNPGLGANELVVARIASVDAQNRVLAAIVGE